MAPLRHTSFDPGSTPPSRDLDSNVVHTSVSLLAATTVRLSWSRSSAARNRVPLNILRPVSASSRRGRSPPVSSVRPAIWLARRPCPIPHRGRPAGGRMFVACLPTRPWSGDGFGGCRANVPRPQRIGPQLRETGRAGSRHQSWTGPLVLAWRGELRAIPLPALGLPSDDRHPSTHAHKIFVRPMFGLAGSLALHPATAFSKNSTAPSG